MLNTISLRFIKENITKGEIREIIKGKIFFKAPDKVVCTVSYPINQLIIVEGNSLIIYYPEEKKALKIRSQNPFSPPLLQWLMMAIKRDYGLSELGYKLEKYKRIGDTLFIYWAPPEHLEKSYGMIKIAEIEGRFIYFESHTPKGKLSTKAIFRKHIKFENSFLPSEIHQEFYSESDTVRETVSFKNIQFNIVIPDSILNFKIPNNIPIEEIEW